MSRTTKPKRFAMTRPEIARRLGMTVDAVRRVERAALDKVRRAIEPQRRAER